VGDVELVADHLAADDRRSHPLELDVLTGRLEDALVRHLDADHQAVLHVGQLAVHLVGPGRLVVLGADVELLEHLGRHLRRNLAGGVAAHAVGDQEQLLVFDEREVVLVVVALHPDVGLRGVADAHQSHPA